MADAHPIDWGQLFECSDCSFTGSSPAAPNALLHELTDKVRHLHEIKVWGEAYWPRWSGLQKIALFRGSKPCCRQTEADAAGI